MVRTLSDLQDISRKIGVSIERVGHVLGVDVPTEAELLDNLQNASTPKEVRWLYDFADYGNKAREQIVSRLIELVSKWLQQVSTAGEAKELYNLVPHECEIKAQALIKWLGLVSTLEEARELRSFPIDRREMSEDHIHWILDKWNEIFSKRLDQVSTLEETQELYSFTPHGSRTGQQVLKKMISFVE